MTRVRPMLVLIFVVLSCAQSQTLVHFTFTPNTGLYATVAIPVSAAPTIDGAQLAPGDEIGVFTSSGLCVGATVWTGSNIVVNVWSDNPFTAEIDGMPTGEQIRYRFWQKLSNREFPSVSASYSLGNGVFTPNGLYVISSMSASSPRLPGVAALVLPPDTAADVPLALVLQWQPAVNALQYRVQLARDSVFQSIVDSDTVSVCVKQTPALGAGLRYFWRVRAENTEGQGAWSAVYRFTTLAPPETPVLLTPKNGAIDVPLSAVLEWQSARRTEEYLVHLSADSTFQTLIDPGLVAGTQKKTPVLAENTGYYWRVRSGNAAGTSQFSSVYRFTTVSGVTRVGDEAAAVREFRVEQNYPNPFNPETHIRFSIPHSAYARLVVYDMLGRAVATLVDGMLQPGWYTVAWNASGMGSGIYVYRVTAGTYSAAKMMMLAK